MSKESTEIIDLDSFKRGLFLALSFLFVSPIVIFISVYTAMAVQKRADVLPKKEILSYSSSYEATNKTISFDFTSQDARLYLLQSYLDENDSPLALHADDLIFSSDKYGFDYRLLPAIAQQESTLCKNSPDNCYNCWGWGIHSKGTLCFNSYEEAIDTVSKGIKEKYLDRGYSTLESIMKKYAPVSQGSWAKGVNLFMEEIESSAN